MNNPTYYHQNVMNGRLLRNVIREVLDIDWCIPPSGIPGNNPPRYVAALGDGRSIQKIGKKIMYIRPKNFPSTTSYPLYQCAKNSSAEYTMKRIPNNLSKLILVLRDLVRKSYGKKVIDVEKMFNVCVCNYYTEDRHQISGHCDDERWLKFNQLDTNDKPFASIIASLTLYIGDIPDKLRNFEIYDDINRKWLKHDLHHNSILLFSNHKHRAKHVGKRGISCRRINITFRTLARGLLGLTGYGNFYRYMSIPNKINYISEKHLEQSKYFIESAKKANIFNRRHCYNENIQLIKVDNDARKAEKVELRKRNTDSLPRYVKPLCTVENYRRFFQ